ncbi:MAG TPA: mechanosensitive ion channel family protein [Thiobacillaceae bacterium]|nr:mechanosensitive ion channel family protein [Thiobacillaceae bacterium]
MKELAERFGIAFLGETWILQIFTVVLVVVALNLFVGFLLRRAERIAGTTSNVWDDALIRAARRPLGAMLWIIGLAYAADEARLDAGLEVFRFTAPMRDVGVVLCLSWFLLRLIRNVSLNVIHMQEALGETVDHTTVDAISKLLRITVLVIAGLVIMQHLGFSITGLLTFGGIGGIAVGFAAKDILANFFGGLTIYLDRPFAVGEWIRSPDKEIEGTVEYIGWRHTRVRAFNKNPIYVPNALFTTIVVENPSRMTNRRIKETIGIRYADVAKMAPIVADVKAMLREHPEIDTDKTLIVNFNTFGPSSLDFFIYTFTKTTEWVRYHEIKQDVLLKVAGIIARHGAEIAFPTRTLHIETEAAEK